MRNKKMIAAIACAAVLLLIAALSARRGAGSDTGTVSTESHTVTEEGTAGKTDSGKGGAAISGGSGTGTDASAGEDGQAAGNMTSDKKDEKAGAESQKSDQKNGSGNADTAGGAVLDDDQGTAAGHSISSQNVSWKNLENEGNTPTERKDPTPTPVTPDDLSFPYTIPDRNLVVKKIASYDGIFLEDGSDAEAEGIAVILLENVGTQAVEYTEIMLSGTGGKYYFECSDLPAGGVAVVQEKDAALFREGVRWRRCECAASMLDELEMSEDRVKVIEDEDGTLLIENISDEDIPCVRVFYKFYSSEDEAFVGGITYTVKITDLAAGSQTTAAPSHYAKGYSKIMMVRTYDTAEG